ncbi:hypothetical protein [Nocardia sp. NPDC046763]|uniref:hypothetical protein n=1 Tax=Nocardia sp. NPDC046763 TaxID=3155256 RepID=UPI0033C49F91
MRHYFASMALADGVSIREFAEYLGHRDASVTLRYYAHPVPSSHELRVCRSWCGPSVFALSRCRKPFQWTAFPIVLRTGDSVGNPGVRPPGVRARCGSGIGRRRCAGASTAAW